jgi:hypothetical protein
VAQHSTGWYLTIRRGPKLGSAYSLPGGTITIGRQPDNHLVIDEPLVSRHHARLTGRGDTFVLEDLNSANGTWVNNVRVTRPVTLRPGDVIGLGQEVLLHFGGRPDIEATVYDALLRHAAAPVAASPASPPAAPSSSSRSWLTFGVGGGLVAVLACVVLAIAGAAIYLLAVKPPQAPSLAGISTLAATPSLEPSPLPEETPTSTPTPQPTATETPPPTATPTPQPTATETPLPTATPTPQPTATETPPPTATRPDAPPEPSQPLEDQPIFGDDFGDPDSGWPVKSDEDGEMGYENGEYFILAKTDGYYFSSFGTDYNFTDFTLEADARQVAGRDVALYGFVFRHQDKDNFYSLFAGSDGEFIVVKKQDGEWDAVADMEWTFSPYIKTGEATNHLKVVCLGAECSFYANQGHLITVQDDTFDAGKVGLVAESFKGSDPIKVAFDNLRVEETTARPAVTPKEAVEPEPPPPTAKPPALNKIAFVSDRDGNQEIYTVNADGSGVTRLTNNPAEDNSPAWSPDGTRIAFVSTRDGNPEIYLMNIDSSGQTNLTNNPSPDDDPTWSPDGRRIAFTSARDDPVKSDIWVMRADGSNQVKLRDFGLSPAWSPNGAQLAGLFRFGGLIHLGLMPADGSAEPRPLLQLNISNSPDWSPDGSRIAFESAESPGDSEILVINADGSNLINLTHNQGIVDSFPTWSPDGTRIAFVSDRDGNNEIYVMPAPGGQVSGITRLTNSPAWDAQPSWSP